MRAGLLNHVVTIQRPVESQKVGGSGHPKVTWSDLATGVLASISPLRGKEFFSAKQFTSEIEFKISMRYRNDVTAKMRIIDEAATADKYYIETPINVAMRNKELQLMCTKIIP